MATGEVKPSAIVTKLIVFSGKILIKNNRIFPLKIFSTPSIIILIFISPKPIKKLDSIMTLSPISNELIIPSFMLLILFKKPPLTAICHSISFNSV